MDRVIEWIDKTLSAVLIGLVALMAISITAEIVLNAMIQPAASALLARADASGVAPDAPYREALRGVMAFVANASAPVNTASQTLLVWVGILGGALAYRQRAHLGVDALARLYPPRIRLWLDYLSTAVTAAFSLAVLVIGGWMVCARAFESGSRMPGMESFNRGWFYLVLPISGALMLVYCVHHWLHPQAAGGDDERGGA
ncbi:MAG: TRAP transporter small permease subunit [bacterium]|nr:TRAP transporter small permease subunit [bacterium]